MTFIVYRLFFGIAMRKIVFFFLPILSSCEHYEQNHGLYKNDIQNIIKIKIKDSKEVVAEIVGFPTLIEPEHPNIWYYISQKHDMTYIASQKILSKKAFKLVFDQNDRLIECREIVLENNPRIFDKDKTDVEPYEEDFLKDVFGNIRSYGMAIPQM